MQFQKTFCFFSSLYIHFTKHFIKNIWCYHSAMKISSCQFKKHKNTTWYNPNHHGAPLVLRLGYGQASHKPKGHRTIPADLNSLLLGSAIQVAGCFWWVVCRNMTGWCLTPTLLPIWSWFSRNRIVHLVWSALSTGQMIKDRFQFQGYD